MLTSLRRNSGRTLLYLDTRALPCERQAEIRAALDQGYRLAVATATPDAYRGYGIHHLIPAPIADHDAAVEQILDYLAHHALAPAGVLAWKDGEVELAARLGTRLGLPCTSPEAARNVRNKARTREILDGFPGLNPRWVSVGNEQDIDAAIEHVGIPCLIKPAGNSGGRGILRITDPRDAVSAYRSFVEYNKSQQGDMFRHYEDIHLVEQEIVGSEHSAAGVVSNGQVIFFGIADKLVDRSLPLQYQNCVPSTLPAEVIANAIPAFRAAVAAVGIDNCGFHIDFMVNAEGVTVLEIGGRLGGELINSHLIPLAQPGLDPYRALLEVVQGRNPLDGDDYTSSFTSSAGSRVVMPPDFGYIDTISGIEAVRRDPRCREFMQLAGPGDEMVPPAEKFKGFEIGYILAQSDEGPVDTTLEELAKLIDIRVVNSPTTT